MTFQPSVLCDGSVVLEGSLDLPRNPHGIVAFSHGSGSSRHSPRNRFDNPGRVLPGQSVGCNTEG